MSYVIVAVVFLLVGGVLDHFFGQKVEKDITGEVVKIVRGEKEFLLKH